MYFRVGNKIEVIEPTFEIIKWCRQNLVLRNPEYDKKINMGLWAGNTPERFYLYEQDGDKLILPFGCVAKLKESYPDVPFKSVIKPVQRFSVRSGISLYPYQEKAAKKALEGKNGILVMPCGSGKTQTALEIISILSVKTLWLTHTQDLLNQSLNRAKSVLSCDPKSYGTITGGKVNIGAGITFATVQTMAKLDLAQYKDTWSCVVVDECMPGTTLIDTLSGKKELKNLCVNDIVTSYNRTTGEVEGRRVLNVFKNKAHHIIRIKLSDGKEIICTSNHPVFVRKKSWVNAERLAQNDYVLRLVWQDSRDRQYAEDEQEKSVRERMVLLLKRVFNKRRTQKDCLDRRKKRGILSQNEPVKPQSPRFNSQKDERAKSHEERGDKKKGISKIEGNGASSENKMWQWNGADCTTARLNDSTCRKVRSVRRVSNTNKNGKRFWLSNLLQNRHCDSGLSDSNRSGWEFSLRNRETKTGQKEGRIFEWVRVDSVEVQEQTSDGTFGGLCSDGYVYNIEVEGNNNYFADGILVHNCHKAVGGPTKVMQFYKVLSNLSCRYKFGLTATPKRADGMQAAMFALLGDILCEIPKSEVANTTCPVKVEFIETGYMPDIDVVLAGDGTLNYASLVDDLTHNKDRFEIVMSALANIPMGQSVLVLANRVEYLQRLCAVYTERQIGEAICLSAMGNSKSAKEARKQALNALNTGELDCVFATYQLAKEGLDVPNLRYVVFATPEKDETTVQQAAGRVARKADGKSVGTVIDFVDSFGMFLGWKKKRVKVYKQLGYEL